MNGVGANIAKQSLPKGTVEVKQDAIDVEFNHAGRAWGSAEIRQPSEQQMKTDPFVEAERIRAAWQSWKRIRAVEHGDPMQARDLGDRIQDAQRTLWFTLKRAIDSAHNK